MSRDGPPDARTDAEQSLAYGSTWAPPGESSRRVYVEASDAAPTGRPSFLGRLAADPSRRLRLLAWMLGASWGGGLLLTAAHVLTGAGGGDLPPERLEILQWAGGTSCIAGLASAWVLLRASADTSWSPSRRATAALLVAVVNALLMSGFETLAPLDEATPGIPAVTAWVMFFPLVLPAPRRAATIAMFASAATAPLAWAVSIGAGVSDAAPLPAVLWTAPAFLAAGVMTIPLRILDRLAREAQRARIYGSYRLVGRLGAGGMGEVWRAEHRLLRRPAAIKLILPGRMNAAPLTASALATFRQEAQAIAELQSPHTVSLYDYGVTDDGQPYLVMELLEGMDLGSLVEAHGPLPAARALHLLRQACASLAEAHAKHLVHRDIKPSNLWVGPFASSPDFLKVLDFGLVQGPRVLRVHGDDQPGTFCGTPAYLPPEAITARGPVDARADVYALGCVAWNLLTGSTVFAADSAHGHVVAHLDETPDAAALRERGVPYPLEALVMSCLAKDPDDRPASMDRLALRLEAIAAGIDPPWTPADARAWWAANG